MFLNQDAFSICLNPCFNGRYSRSYKEVAGFYRDVVLILVLMEDTLGAEGERNVVFISLCLNPCFNGRYSRRLTKRVKAKLSLS